MARRRNTTSRRPRVQEQAPEGLEEHTDDLRPVEKKGGAGRAVVLTVVGALLGGGAVFGALQFMQKNQGATQPTTAAPAQDNTPEPVPTPAPHKADPKPAPVEKKPEPAAPAAEPKPAKTAAKEPAPKKTKATKGTAKAADSGTVDDADMATLKLSVTPWADVWVDGKKVGRTPLQPLKLKPGKHVIKLENGDWHVSRKDTVQLTAGGWGELAITFTPPPGK